MVVTNQFNLIDMKKIIFLMIALLTVTAMVAQTRRSNTSRTSGSVRKTTRTTADVGKKTQGTKTTASPSVIFSLPDETNKEEDYLSAMNTQLYETLKYVAMDSPYIITDPINSITYKLIYAIQTNDGIQVRMLCKSNMDMIGDVGEMTIIQGNKEIRGERMYRVFGYGDYSKYNGSHYIIDYFFKTSMLIEKIEKLYVKCFKEDSQGNYAPFEKTFSNIVVKDSKSTEFLYPSDGKNLNDLKSDNMELFSNLGFKNHPNEYDLDGLKIKVVEATSFQGKIRVTLKFTNNTDRKKRIIYDRDNGMPFVLTVTGRILKGDLQGGNKDINNVWFDIEGGSYQNFNIDFNRDGDDSHYLQLFHFKDAQSGHDVVLHDILVKEQPKPHGELRFDMTWGEAKNLGYVTDGRGGDCTYSVYEGVEFNSCRLSFPDSNEGKLQNVHFESHDELARSKYNKMSSILKKKYNQIEMDKSKYGYDFHDHPLIFITTNRDYWLKLNLNEPAFGATRVTLDIIKN